MIVTASDGTLSDTQAIAVTVTNVNEAPVITSNGGSPAGAVSVAENGTVVTTIVAGDVDAGTTLTYSISGGADAGKFQINAQTGALVFKAAPNFEAPGDAGGNNVYDVTVTASDGTLTDTQAIAVTVTNVNEAPVITSGGGGSAAIASLFEKSTAVTTVAASDADAGAHVTYSVGGTDGALFQIDPVTGALSFKVAPNYLTPGDAGGNNVYDVVVTASDGTLTDTQAIAVTVLPLFNYMKGTAAANEITGTAGADYILGFAGNDRLFGLGGNDVLDGGLGRNTLTGGTGDDLYLVSAAGDKVVENAGEGIDTVQTGVAKYSTAKNVENLTFTSDVAHTGTGNELANHLIGGGGSDVLNGLAGADVLEGGSGDDIYYVDNIGDSLIEAAGGGSDTVFSTVSYTLAAEVENLTLQSSKTPLNATGNASDNVLIGNRSDNVLSGLGGDDTLAGGKGLDTLTGGSGSDTFLFDTSPSTTLNFDRVTDFVSGTDRLAFDQTVFKAFTAVGAINAAAFLSGAGVNVAHDADDRLIYNTTTGALWYDADGTGKTRAIEVAVLTGHPDLVYGDFLIVA